MLLAAGIVALFNLHRSGVALVGEIPRGLPSLALPSFSGIELAAPVPAALGVAVVGYSDNVLAARAFAARRPGTQAYDLRRRLLVGAWRGV